MKVLGIGESVLDKVYLINGLEPHTPFSLQTTPQKHVGGPVLAALVLLSRLGIECTFLTSVGRDEHAELIRSALRHENIRMIGKIQKRTKVNKIIVDSTNGQRQKIRGEIIHPPIKNLERKFLHQFDVIIIDRHEQLAFYEILQKKKSTTKIIIDPSTEVSQFTLDMMKYSDYPIIPIEALPKIGNANDLLHCLDQFYTVSGKPVTVTAGELGSIVFDGNELSLIPSLDVQAVDVTGAGDIYRGGFAYGVIQGWHLNECAWFANMVAGMQCAKIGNLAAIPTKEEIEVYQEVSMIKKEVTMSIITEYFAHL